MSSTSKRVAGGTTSPALVNAALLFSAVACGFWLLVSRGQMKWPPSQLLGNLYTVAGCLALVGPIVLARRDSASAGLGDLIWMAAGALIWVSDLAALAQGDLRPVHWPTPLSYQAMGLSVLAILIAGWRIHGVGHAWSWTNVIGWFLGLFWVGMGIASLWPGASLALRG